MKSDLIYFTMSFKNFIKFIFIFFFIFQQTSAKNLKIMVFAAHPDDELIGCGGSISKHLQLGNQVQIIYLTSGDAGSIKYNKEELALMREKEALIGLKILSNNSNNIKAVFLHKKDGYLEVNAETLIQTVEVIRTFKPDIIYIPHAEEVHNDHRTVNDLVSKAINKARGNWFQEAKGEPCIVKTVFTYEIYPLQKTINYCEDISAFMSLKLTALREHETQIESIRYDDLAESIGRYRGILNNGTKYAECFEAVKISNDLFN